MKRIKQTISILLAVVMAMCILPVAASAETVSGECGLEGDNLTWTFDTETGVLTIDGEGEMDNYSLYNNINRTSAPWWDYHSQITELVIGDEVTSIGDYAFYNCNTPKNLTVPGNVISIGDYAFYNCGTLRNLTISEGVITIGDYAFYDCSITDELIIPDSVEKIGSYSFAENNILSLYTGNGLSEISEWSFKNNIDLSHIEWGTNIKIIGERAFFYQSPVISFDFFADNTILIPDGVETIKSYAFGYAYRGGSTKVVSIPLSVKRIEGGAFRDSVGDVYYEGTIEQWEKIALYGNEGLRNATIHFGHSHEYTSEITTEPTCTKTGVKTYTCSCGESYTRTLSALGHDIVMDSAVPATCTETGLTQGEHCSRCDYSVPQEETPALGHDEVEIPAVPATCTSTGLTAGTGCSRCDMIFEQQEVTPMVDHTIETVSAVAPTCTQTGLTEGRICTACGEVFDGQQEIPALGHTVVTDPATPATCTTSGLTEGSHCSVCGEVLAEQEYIPATGHTEVFTEYVEPTCTEDGKTIGKVCSVCGEVIIPAVTIPARGHHYTEWITTANPTCTVDGKQIKICACGLFEEESIPAAGHADADGDGVCDNCLCVTDGTQQGEEEKPNSFFARIREFFAKLIEMIKNLFK